MDPYEHERQRIFDAQQQVHKERDDYKRMYEETAKQLGIWQSRAAAATGIQPLVQRAITRLHDKIAARDIVTLRDALDKCLEVLEEAHGGDYKPDEQERFTAALKTARLLVVKYAHITADCGCIETYPQLVPGTVSHGPGCPKADSGAA